MRALSTILLLTLFCTTIFGQYSIIDEDNALNKKEVELLEKAIDFQLDFYNTIFPEKNIVSTDVKLNVYTDYGAYLVYQKEQRGDTKHRSMGFYSSKNKEAVVCKDKNEKRFLQVCYHELSHFFIRTYIQDVPIWLNEGLAVHFEHIKISPKKIEHQTQQRYINRVKTMIDTRDIDLKDFVNWDGRKFSKMSFSHDSYGYAIGYTIVLFLTEKDKNLLANLMQEVNSGKKSIEAFNSFYEGGFSQFESDYLAYIKK